MFDSRCPGASRCSAMHLGTISFPEPSARHRRNEGSGNEIGTRLVLESWRKTYAFVNIYHFRFYTCPIYWEVKDDLDGKNFQPSQRGVGVDFQAPRWPRSWHGRKDVPKIPQCFFYRPNLATSL